MTPLEAYHHYKALGICVSCHFVKASENRLRCDNCAEKRRNLLNSPAQREKDNARHRKARKLNPIYNQRTLDAYNRLRLKIYDKYGNVCACCGEREEAFLSIDHVNGGGNRERKSRGLFGYKFLVSVRDDPDPTRYQLLCFNCNCAKGFRGQCPHQALKDN